MMSTRERIRPSEAVAALRNRGRHDILGDHVPIADRSWVFTTYGKGAFELAVRHAGLANTRMVVPAFISHDFVGIFDKYDITPVFVDIDPSTYHITRHGCEELDLTTVSSLILLHTFGLPADGGSFRDLCDDHGLVMIEDCARALGAERDGHLVGWHGDYAAFSLSKVAPVRRGGLLVSRRPLDVSLPRGRGGLSGVANHLLLVKLPGLQLLEGPLYRLLQETRVYPGEVGLYDPPTVEQPERIVEYFFEAFLPHYGDGLRIKRQRALEIRHRLEPLGFAFQADPGNHIYTALGARMPPSVTKKELRRELKRNAINTYTLWSDPLGTSRLAQERWGTDGAQFPVTAELAERLIHFPISRFVDERQIDRLVDACRNVV